MTQSIALRNQNYLNSTPYDLTQKRSEFIINLRKKKRLTNFQKYRESNPFQLSGSQNQFLGPSNPVLYLLNISSLEILCSLTPSSPLTEIFEVLEHITKSASSPTSILSLLSSPDSITSLISLSNHSDPSIKFQVFQILTSLSRLNPQELADHCPDPIFSRILKYTEENSKEILLTTLNCVNIFISSDQRFFELFQSRQGLPRLLEIVKSFKDFAIFQCVGNCCLNLSEYESLFSQYETLVFLDVLMEVVRLGDARIKNDGILAVGNLLRADSEKIELFMQHGLFQVVYEAHKNPEFSENWVKTLGNLTSGTFQQTQKLMDLGLLDIYWWLIGLRTVRSISFIYFSLSNIAAGVTSQFYQLIDHPVFEAALKNIEYLDENGKVEASYLLRNVFKLGNISVKNLVFKLGMDYFMPYFTNLSDIKGTLNILMVLKESLKHLGRDLFIEKGFYDLVEKIQTHKNPKIYKKCLGILDPY